MTEEELTEEKMEELATKSILAKDKILDALNGEETRIGLSAITAAAAEIICATAPSLNDAVEAIAMLSSSIVTLIRFADEDGECYWKSHPSETRQ